MRSSHEIKRARVVSFSGVDGAGKSTQIERLFERLKERGLRVQIIRFWDDIAQLKTIREGAGHKLFKGDKGIGSPETPINRRDKNVGGWPMTYFRYFLYLMDAISLRSVFKNALLSDTDFIIFDRYTYDELANLDLTRALTRAYTRMIMGAIPRPDISFVLDADPEAARARKPEYPIEFVHLNRRAYMQLNQRFGGFTIIEPLGIEAVHREVLNNTLRILTDDDAERGNDSSAISEQTPEMNASGSNPALL